MTNAIDTSALRSATDRADVHGWIDELEVVVRDGDLERAAQLLHDLRVDAGRARLPALRDAVDPVYRDLFGREIKSDCRVCLRPKRERCGCIRDPLWLMRRPYGPRPPRPFQAPSAEHERMAAG